MAKRQMCMCESIHCPLHREKGSEFPQACDSPAAAKVRLFGILTALCHPCLQVAIGVAPEKVTDVTPIRTAKLLHKDAQGTGNQTFDRVWDDFNSEAHAEKNEGHPFEEILAGRPVKHQVLVSLGKLNYMLENGGFERWIEEGYAFHTGDILLHKLPAHDHAYPVLSKVHDLLGEVLKAYASFGVESYAALERLLTGRHRGFGIYWFGPPRETLWEWFGKLEGEQLAANPGVHGLHDLEHVSGKWGDITVDEPLTMDLLDRYAAQAAEAERELAALPEPKHKTQVEKREYLMDEQASLDAIADTIDSRLALRTAWKQFVAGGWSDIAKSALDGLDTDYHEIVTMDALVDEAAEWFDANPDDIGPVVEEGETAVTTEA